ncbi:MAG TPA: methyltransferase [Caulobacteraceae bacterium]|nr:methyltransferase [Caulobacteraceae bacterium]
MRRLVIAGLSALLLSSCGTFDGVFRGDPGPAIEAALADPSRPAADRERDAARKPEALIRFAGVRPGDTVGDFVTGGGYFARIFAGVVGPQGRVHAVQPQEFVGFMPKYGEDLKALDAAYDNVTGSITPFATPDFPAGLDVVWTSQNYHDLHLKPFPADTAARANKAIFQALRPGGVYLIIDHAAEPGSGLRDAHDLHRIDPETVKQEVTAAGFVFEGESPLLRNPADPKTANVFDESIRGRTDQFVYKFRKPRH